LCHNHNNNNNNKQQQRSHCQQCHQRQQQTNNGWQHPKLRRAFGHFTSNQPGFSEQKKGRDSRATGKENRGGKQEGNKKGCEGGEGLTEEKAPKKEGCGKEKGKSKTDATSENTTNIWDPKFPSHCSDTDRDFSATAVSVSAATPSAATAAITATTKMPWTKPKKLSWSSSSSSFSSFVFP
jgi:hypothetical protein